MMMMIVLVMEVLAVLEGHHCFLCFLLPFPALLPEAASSAGLSAAPVPKGCHQQRMPGAFLPLSSPFHRCNNHFVGTVAGAVLCVRPQLSPACPGATGLPMCRGSSSSSHPAVPPPHTELDPQMCHQHHRSVHPMHSPAPLCPHETETSSTAT